MDAQSASHQCDEAQAPKYELVKVVGQCNTVPPKVYLCPRDTVQFHTVRNQKFLLVFPGGVFVGHSEQFAILVEGTTPRPSTPLEVAPNAPTHLIRNYVFDENGQNCKEKDKVDPPEILIGS
jgi:hypothetical protein